MEQIKKSLSTNELFSKYLKEDVTKAQIIAKNLFCKNPGDIKVFIRIFPSARELYLKDLLIL